MTQRFRFWGAVDPQARTHLALVAPQATAPVVENAGTTAVLYLYEPFDADGGFWGTSAQEFTAALLSLGEDVSTIELRINSPGGDAFQAFAIINALRQHPAKVVAVVDALAASAAADIAVSADRLVMADNAQLMIHRAFGIEIGTTEDLASYAQMLANLDNAQADMLVARAGGTRAEWLDAMTPGTWYSAQQAKDAGIADEVRRVTPAVPAESDAQARFDLSLLPERDATRVPFAPAARLTDPPPADPKTPANTPVAPSTTPEEADTMSDTIPKAVLEALGLPDDADEATVASAVTALQTERDEAKAQADARPKPVVDPKDAAAALEAEGKVVLSQTMFDEIKAQAADGAKARAKQLEEERDATIAKAFTDGKISADRRDAWKASWDKDPEGTKADLESLPSRFPVAQAPGVPGGDAGSAVAFTDDEAGQLAQLAGVHKEALTA